MGWEGVSPVKIITRNIIVVLNELAYLTDASLLPVLPARFRLPRIFPSGWATLIERDLLNRNHVKRLDLGERAKLYRYERFFGETGDPFSRLREFSIILFISRQRFPAPSSDGTDTLFARGVPQGSSERDRQHAAIRRNPLNHFYGSS